MQLVKYNVMMYINMLEPTRHTGDAPDPCRTGEHNLKFQNFGEIWDLHTIPYRNLCTAAQLVLTGRLGQPGLGVIFHSLSTCITTGVVPRAL